MLNGDADRRDCFEYHVGRPQAHLIAREDAEQARAEVASAVEKAIEVALQG
jgi:hypothetical protein